MLELAKIGVYLTAVIMGGALLAPPLWWLGQWVMNAGWLPQLRPFSFDKYFNRAALILAIVGLPVLLRQLRLKSWGALGLVANPRRWSDLAMGLGTACTGFTGVVTCLVAAGRLHLRLGGTPSAWLQVTVVALVVGVGEEVFFRGVLFGVLRRSLRPSVALGWLSVFFAGLHFLRPNPAMPQPRVVFFTSGFVLLPHLVWEYAQPQRLLACLLTLTLMAVILGYTVLRSQSLYWAIGLHAGWVLCIKGLGLLIDRPGGADRWLGEDLRSGLAPLALMGVTGVVVWAALHDRWPAAPTDGRMGPYDPEPERAP